MSGWAYEFAERRRFEFRSSAYGRNMISYGLPLQALRRLERMEMRRLLVLALFLGVSTCGLCAQAVDTTVCAVLKNPAAFNGKMVRIKGTVVAGFDQYELVETDCGYPVNGIWISYPAGSKVKSGPMVMVQVEPAHNFAGTVKAEERTPVTLVKDKEFKHFDSLLAQLHTIDQGLCLGCIRYEVQATLVGRLDGVDNAALTRDASGKIVGLGGFGNMNAYPARLVLESVSGVTEKEIDYSKIDAIAKGGASLSYSGPPQGGPLELAKETASRLSPSTMTTLIKGDLDVFGNSIDSNGVDLEYGPLNEVSAADDAPGKQDAPGGVILLCHFSQNRIEDALSIDRVRMEDALALGYVHLGQDVNDLRNPPPGGTPPPLFLLENNAWAVTASMAMADGEKYFSLPGGYIVWNSKWPAEDRGKNMEDALKDFLTNEEYLRK
jgi:hypothetical protein